MLAWGVACMGCENQRLTLNTLRCQSARKGSRDAGLAVARTSLELRRQGLSYKQGLICTKLIFKVMIMDAIIQE